VVDVCGTQADVTIEHEFVSADYASFDDLMTEFMATAGTIHSAAFSVAVPVRYNTVQSTNLPCRITADALRKSFSFASCHLLNNLETPAYGLTALQVDDV
jgi:glucokinase